MTMLDRPKFALVADDDEPVAAPASVLDRAGLDRRDIQRVLIRSWSTVYHLLVDRSGRPTGCEHLHPNYRPNPDGFKRHGEPRLVEFSGPDPREETLGAWFNRGGDGKSGANLFELVMYLDQCDVKTATAFLNELSDRLVDIKSLMLLYAFVTMASFDLLSRLVVASLVCFSSKPTRSLDCSRDISGK
jgi:hypothetical protein